MDVMGVVQKEDKMKCPHCGEENQEVFNMQYDYCSNCGKSLKGGIMSKERLVEIIKDKMLHTDSCNKAHDKKSICRECLADEILKEYVPMPEMCDHVVKSTDCICEKCGACLMDCSNGQLIHKDKVLDMVEVCPEVNDYGNHVNVTFAKDCPTCSGKGIVLKKEVE